MQTIKYLHGALIIAAAAIWSAGNHAQAANIPDPMPHIKSDPAEAPHYAQGEIIVKYKGPMAEKIKQRLHDNTAVGNIRLSPRLDELNQKYKVMEIRPFVRDRDLRKTEHLQKIYKLKLGVGGPALKNAIKEYGDSPDIEYAELNYIVSVFRTPNDPLFDKQWALNNIGQACPPNNNSGTVDSDIDAPQAWDSRTDSNSIIVAVIDTGVDYSHPELAQNMWTDSNGFYGYDFVNGDNDPMDDHGHGTHCAGIIGAKGDNGVGITGINWTARIMAVKFLDSAGRGFVSDAALAINYAVENGARVLSNSWGSEYYSQVLQDAVNDAHTKGVIVIAAAGNDGDTRFNYPAACDNVISIAATDANDRKAGFSTYGNWVDLAAPGVDILSTIPSGYRTWSGTSMACPHVAGACTMLLAENPMLTPDELCGIVMATTDRIFDPNEQICISNGRLNLYKAVSAADPSTGVINLDKTSYPCSGTVNISARDRDLSGQGNVSVTISASNGDYETATLAETAQSGRFSGTIPTGPGAVNTGDGLLQLSNGDIISAIYQDANDGNGQPAIATDAATTDCNKPAISDVSIYGLASIVTIKFKTDEPAITRILCGEICGGPYIIEAAGALTTNHSIKLKGLAPDTDHYFIVEAADVVGNKTTDDNNGSCYTFVTNPSGDVNVPGDFNTIQEAVDNCWDGFTVWVDDGVYTGDGNYDIKILEKGVVVKSRNGPDNCIIDCRNKGRGFIILDVNDANIAINGFTIKNGWPAMASALRNDDAEAGGGIYCFNSNLTLSNCKISENFAAGKGGGIYCRNSGTACLLQISNSDVCRNISIWGGGGILCYGDIRVDNSTVSANATDSFFSPAIECQWGKVEIIGSTISGNISTYNGYGGGACLINCEGNIRNSVFTKNAAQWGGGLCFFQSTAAIVNTLLVNNTSLSGGGGGIRCHEDSNVTVTNCTISNNTAGNYYYAILGGFYDTGGGIQCLYGQNNIVIENSVLWGNSDAGNTGKQIYLYSLQGPDYINTAAVSYSDIEGGLPDICAGQYAIVNWGQGNIAVDPMFAFVADYHLMHDSPCVNTGTNEPAGGLPSNDLEGNNRPLDITADMGAYEYNVDSPCIAVSSTEFQFSCQEDGSNTAEQTILIRNCGSGTLSWQISENCGWLNVCPASGFSEGQVNNVTLDVDADGLVAGDYQCEMTINAQGASNDPRTVIIKLHVSGELHVPVFYPTIQAGINAAWDGDTVVVSDGIYSGSGNRDISFFGKIITVKSLNGPDGCIIDCGGSAGNPHRGFDFRFWDHVDPNAVIDGFTIKNGYVTDNPNNISHPGYGGAIFSIGAHPSIKRCIIKDNWAAIDGGAIYAVSRTGLDGLLHLNNCIVIGNTAGENGGGIWLNDHGTIEDSIVAGNKSGKNGAGVWAFGDCHKIGNCTLSNNTAGLSGGAVFAEGGDISDSRLQISNCILWDNTAAAGSEAAITDINPQDSIIPVLAVYYSDIRGGTDSVVADGNSILEWGAGNIDQDPCFVNSEIRNYHIRYDSVCIDAGDPNLNYSGQTDIDGERRVAGTAADIGADEYYRSRGDFNADGTVDLTDFAVLSAAWQSISGDNNYNGICDLEDDGRIDIYDLSLFFEDWLWEKAWDGAWTSVDK